MQGPIWKPDRRSVIAGAGMAVMATAGGTSMRNLVIKRRDVTTIDDRGGSLVGVRAAMRDIHSAGGGTLRFRTPIIRISAPELIANGPIVLAQETTIEGEGVSFVVNGTALSPPVFLGENVSRVAIRNLDAIGNLRGIADTRTGTFACFRLSNAATGDMEDIRLENIGLSDFGGERWVQFLQRHGNRRMTGLSIAGLRASGGSSLAPGVIGISAAPLWIHGAEGEIDDVKIRHLEIDASNLKEGVVLFHKVRRVTLDAVSVTNAGVKGASDDAGAYAISAYADRGEMSDISIVAPVIANPRSVGIYLRGVEKVHIANPRISGQTDIRSDNLPKGAIALNGSTDVVINGGLLTDNAFDISVADGNENILDLEVNRVTTHRSGTSIVLAISPGRGAISGARFINCELSGRDRVLRVMNDQVPGRHYDDISVVGGTLHSETAANIIEITQGAATQATGYRIENVTIRTNHVGIMCAGFRGQLQLRHVTIDGLGKLDYGIIADDCQALDWDGVTFRNMPTGYAYTARALHRAVGGSIRNLQFVDVSRPAILGSLAAD